jgi:phenylalanine-4-hydroxylase
VFSKGLQVSGTFTEVIDEGRDPIYVRTTGPSALSINNVQMENYGKERFPNGISMPVGKSVKVDGTIVREDEVMIELRDVTVTYNNEVIDKAPFYIIPKGDVVSAFAGPADPEAFEPNVNVPREKMHKIKYDKQDLELHELYRHVRNTRANTALVPTMPDTWQKVVKEFPSDWLLPLEILEVLQTNAVEEELQSQIWSYLEAKAAAEPSLKKLIDNGLSLLKNSFTPA